MCGAGQCDPASSLHPTSSADLTATPEGKDDCETPSKVLKKISRIPWLPQNNNSKRRQSAAHLTSQFTERKQQKMTGKIDKQKKRGTSMPKKTVKLPRLGRTKRIILSYSSSSSENDLPGPVYDDEDNDSSLNEDKCVECLEKYNKTKSTSDWIQCVNCRKLLHEACGNRCFAGRCGLCGRIFLRLKLQKEQKQVVFVFLSSVFSERDGVLLLHYSSLFLYAYK
jgi:hypothetical protein